MAKTGIVYVVAIQTSAAAACSVGSLFIGCRPDSSRTTRRVLEGGYERRQRAIARSPPPLALHPAAFIAGVIAWIAVPLSCYCCCPEPLCFLGHRCSHRPHCWILCMVVAMGDRWLSGCGVLVLDHGGEDWLRRCFGRKLRRSALHLRPRLAIIVGNGCAGRSSRYWLPALSTRSFGRIE